MEALPAHPPFDAPFPIGYTTPATNGVPIMNARLLLAACVSIALLSGCSKPVPELKSPCVGAEGAPCDRRPANAPHPV